MSIDTPTKPAVELPEPNMEWASLASEASLERTATALREKGYEVFIADDFATARQVVLDKLPKGAEVSQGASKTLEETGVSPDVRVKDLAEEDLVKLRDWIDANYKVEGDLRREVASDIRRKIEIGCYQGIRHRRGLPVHGQRTHTNARTRKGPKKTVAGKKKPKK